MDLLTTLVIPIQSISEHYDEIGVFLAALAALYLPQCAVQRGEGGVSKHGYGIATKPFLNDGGVIGHQ